MSNLPAVTTPWIPFDELQRMGMAIAKGGLFGTKTPEQAISLMLVAQAEGRHPASAAQDYDIIQNKPAKKAIAMLRDFQQAGGSIEWHELSDTKAEATFSHSQGGKVKIDWDIPRANKAGLCGKDNWKKYPRAMLRSRVVSEGVRTVFPAATGGCYTPEEVEDMRDVTPESSAEEVARLQAAREELIPGLNPPRTPQQLFDHLKDTKDGLRSLQDIAKTVRAAGWAKHAQKLDELIATVTLQEGEKLHFEKGPGSTNALTTQDRSEASGTIPSA